jgi:hypothetical protein
MNWSGYNEALGGGVLGASVDDDRLALQRNHRDKYLIGSEDFASR